MSSSLVPLKTRHVGGGQCKLNLSMLRRPHVGMGKLEEGIPELRYRPRHLIIFQNYEIRCQKHSCSLIERHPSIHSRIDLHLDPGEALGIYLVHGLQFKNQCSNRLIMT
ncbi:hypothetical protein TNCV_3850241 [Trichonephila clavipes]|nr:hypothetical protein TNCV_3850241 [Trichonephila clavipes]